MVTFDSLYSELSNALNTLRPLTSMPSMVKIHTPAGPIPPGKVKKPGLVTQV